MDAFGSKLVTKGGEVDTASLIGDDVGLVGLYFSAHWCPPCRAFTPKLADFYNKVNAEKKVLEIIFVSHDRDDKSFQEYLDTMPWAAIPFDSDDIKERLIKKHNVSGIPKLVFVSKSGEMKFEDGRDKVTNDAANFPWN